MNWAVVLHKSCQRERVVEHAGIYYECCALRDSITLGYSLSPLFEKLNMKSLHGTVEASKENSNDDDVDEFDETSFDADDEVYFNYLTSLDPNDFKNQDHYKVLGLSKLRWKATKSHIRTAYRNKVLRYHPDKRPSNVLRMKDDYFVCISRAYDQLGISVLKRRAYDSVDPLFDDSVPDEKSINDKNFFRILAPVFERNARWSKIVPVPSLGNKDSSRQEVDKFYEFWFAWTSWREFSYLDKEDKQTGCDRYEKREIEKQNKIEREASRKAESSRIRNFVQMAYKCDFRLRAFVAEDKQRKEETKRERERLRMEKKAEEQRMKMEEEMERQKEEERVKAERKQKLADERKAQVHFNKQLNSARKGLRSLAKTAGYWTSDDRIQLNCMEIVESICLLADINEIKRITNRIKLLSCNEEIRQFLSTERHQLTSCKKENEQPKEVESKAATLRTTVNWSTDELALLTKATNLFAAGTSNRWFEVASYVNKHRKDNARPLKTEKVVLLKIREIKNGYSVPHTELANGLSKSMSSSEKVWSNTEQRALEKGLELYPSTDSQRWEKIATEVGRTKKECVKRFKYIAAFVKAKKSQ